MGGGGGGTPSPRSMWLALDPVEKFWLHHWRSQKEKKLNHEEVYTAMIFP